MDCNGENPGFIGFRGPGLDKFLNFGIEVASSEYEVLWISEPRSFLADYVRLGHRLYFSEPSILPL